MRAVQLALLIMMIQAGIGIMVESGIYNGIYFENKLTNFDISGSPSALSDTEQTQASISVMNRVFDSLTWGWISQFFEPMYTNDAAVHAFIDSIVLFLRSVSLFVLGIAFIEFVRNQVNVLGSGR